MAKARHSVKENYTHELTLGFLLAITYFFSYLFASFESAVRIFVMYIRAVMIGE
jgi:hypothetical protein